MLQSRYFVDVRPSKPTALAAVLGARDVWASYFRDNGLVD